MSRYHLIRDAALSLNHDDPNDWEENGRPKIEILRRISGIPSLTLREVDWAMHVACMPATERAAFLRAHFKRVNRQIAAMKIVEDARPKQIRAVGDLITLNKWAAHD